MTGMGWPGGGGGGGDSGVKDRLKDWEIEPEARCSREPASQWTITTQSVSSSEQRCSEQRAPSRKYDPVSLRTALCAVLL